MDLYPLKFEPIYLEKIWGGRNLERLFGRRLPADKPIGESWELADLPEGVSVIRNGPLAGRTLGELTGVLGPGLLGRARPAPTGRFPLLLKLLDANDKLSLQVHPDREAARRIGPPALAKSECWYVIESRGGFIIKDLQPGVSLERFAQAVRAGQVEPVVCRLEVAAGDFHYLPAGTVHALGSGVVVAEVQTPSDTTYRVTDWGRGREIHVERSLECIRPHQAGPAMAGETLLASEHFRVARRRQAAGQTRPLPPGRCVALMTLQADRPATIRHDGPILSRVDAAAGETVLLPAGLRSATLHANAECEYLEITLPQSAREA